MKNESSELITHNDARIEFSGTCLQGYVYPTYARLVEVFGDPIRYDDGYRVQAEWNFKINGEIGTIYDWKENGTPPEEVTEWHVGGFTPSIVEAVRRFLA